MGLGLCLSFCHKRFGSAAGLAAFVEALGIGQVQFSWDLVNPWWEEKKRDGLAARYAEEFYKRGIRITSSFSGLSAYAYPNLLAADETEREMGMALFKRAADMAAAMGVPAIGMPAGTMCREDRLRPERRELLYERLVKDLTQLSLYAARKGLREIQLEPTPVEGEIPNTAAQALRLMESLEGATAVPVRLVLDWGHVLCPPLDGGKADMNDWLDICGSYVSAFHLQQCDGKMDRHWGFSVSGLVLPDRIAEALRHSKGRGLVQYLEYCPAFETPDGEVMAEVRYSVRYLREIFEREERRG